MGKKQRGEPVLTPEMARAVVEMAVEEGIKAYHQEADKQRKLAQDKRLRNTKLLLKNFLELEAHSQNSVFELSKVNDGEIFDILDMMTRDSSSLDMQVESIKTSVGRTQLIVEHVREMLRLYEISCERSKKPEDMRRYRIIKGLYLEENPKTIQEIADEEGIDISTAYKDLNAGIRRLTALIFGVDGLNQSPAPKSRH